VILSKLIEQYIVSWISPPNRKKQTLTLTYYLP